MSKIKFIEAEFHNADKDRRAIRQRLERFLKTRRALERGIVPPDQDDRDDRLRWETELMQVGLGREGQDRVDRRVSRLAERRAAAAGLSHLKLDDRRALEVLRNGVELIRIRTEHQADEIAAGIHADMPWMAPATDLLWKSMRRSVCNGDAGFRLPPVLLNGPPGIGKSMWARQLSTALGLPRCGVEATAEQASFGIVGSQRGWSNAQPGRPLMTILKHLTANPVVVVDEVEKAGVATSTKGNCFGLTEGLLSLLEPSSAASWQCPFYQVGFDMSWICWVLTSNSLVTLPAPRLSRLEVIHLPPILVVKLAEFARREGRRRGLTQASVEAVAEALEIAGQGRELNLRHVIRMLARGEAMERADFLH
ncbi:AAA family ATPase [Phaeobacter inhibens]|uniref:AAA family ATPase n=1 Tax=Phaeobacter inhibens TaxID=221822 RepID=UPI000C9A624D|nr:AAA family ATPase [Phaeobacter inhibens]AUQ67405.1 ATP-dependent protease La [Phaeobacter inhibens]